MNSYPTFLLSINAREGQCASVRGNLYNYLGEIILRSPLQKLIGKGGLTAVPLFVLSKEMDNGQVLTKAGAAQKQARQKEASLRR